MNKFDISFLNENIKLIAGVDEAGRGPLAGPVVAAAVIFDEKSIIRGVKDSKILDEPTRDKLYKRITERAVCFGVGIVDHTEIDRINILNASLLAMKKAVSRLTVNPDLILVDGNKVFYSRTLIKPIIKGDALSFSISAASIIAKVTRDKIMKEAAKKFPGYSWETNKGYGTAEHVKAIRKLGHCELHRKTFLRNILSSENETLSFTETGNIADE